MISDLAALREAVRAGEEPEFRFFWSHCAKADGRLTDACFSQWWPASFTVDGTRYGSAEQFMMAEKARIFSDLTIREKILRTSSPEDIKRLGRAVAGFDEGVWANVRFDVVTAASSHKFGQSAELRAYLLASGHSVLVEASPLDRVWGIGLEAADPAARNPFEWRGENLLGFALMRARQAITVTAAPNQS